MRLYAILALSVVALAPASARAEESSPVVAAPAAEAAHDPQVARLLAAKAMVKWNHTPPGKTDRYGHAEALVAAPADAVARVAGDFARYKDLHRKFSTARVINKEGESTDVYMRYPVKLGAVKIEFTEVLRFGAVRNEGGTFVLEANAIRGDMKSGHAKITVRPVDATHSIVTCDILLVPRVFLPQSAVDQELRNGAGDYVNGLKDRAQGYSGNVASL